MRLPFLKRRRVRLVTWNVWFGIDRPLRRWEELLRTTGRLRPDVVAFQEVTKPFLKLLRNTSWVRKSYTPSDPYGDEMDAYGSVLLCRYPSPEVSIHRLESEMDRSLVTMKTEVAGAPWLFGTVHLESMEGAHLRGRQLEVTFEHLARHDNVVLMGDFNFCSAWTDENRRIPEDWVDVWPALRSEPGFTVDTGRNAMRLRAKPQDKRVRFDRILVRSPLATPVRIELLGTTAIKGEQPALFPSDHFGVFAELSLEGG